MNAQLREIADELLPLARQQDANGTAAAICTLIATGSFDEIVVAAARREIAEAARERIDRPTAITTFAQLSEMPLATCKASLLIGAFESGELIEAADLEAIEQLFLTRPVGTYGFLFLGTEKLAYDEGREHAERAAWRLLVPEPKPRWAQQDLAEHNIFFSHGDAVANGAPSREHGRGLTDLVSGTPQAVTEMEALALHRVIDELEEKLGRLSEPAATAPPSAIEAVEEEITTLRLRMRRKIESATSEIQRGMETSVLRLRQDLLNGLDAALRGSGGHSDRSELRRNFQRFLSSAVESWSQGTEPELRQRLIEIADEASAAASSVDWEQVNLAARRAHLPAIYPAAFHDALHGAHLTSGWPQSFPSASQPAGEPAVIDAKLAILGGGGLIYALYTLVNPLTGVLGALLLGTGGWAIYRSEGVRRYREYGRNTIVAVTEQLLAQVEAVISDAVQELRRRLKSELLEIEKILSTGLGAGQTVADTHRTALPAPHLAILRQLRHRLEDAH